MPKLSRRLWVFSAALLIVLLTPLAVFVFVSVRAVFTPPVAGTKFFSYDGLRLAGACDSQPSSQGGQVLLCTINFRISSRFAVVDHSSAAVGWCIDRVNETHFSTASPQRLGPLLVGHVPIVPADWGECSDMVPRQVGLYGQLVWRH